MLENRYWHGHPRPAPVNFPRNPIGGLVRARREDVRENSSRFVHLRPTKGLLTTNSQGND